MKGTKIHQGGYFYQIKLTWHEYLALQKLVKNATENRDEEITKRIFCSLAE